MAKAIYNALQGIRAFPRRGSSGRTSFLDAVGLGDVLGDVAKEINLAYPPPIIRDVATLLTLREAPARQAPGFPPRCLFGLRTDLRPASSTTSRSARSKVAASPRCSALSSGRLCCPTTGPGGGSTTEGGSGGVDLVGDLGSSSTEDRGRLLRSFRPRSTTTRFLVLLNPLFGRMPLDRLPQSLQPTTLRRPSQGQEGEARPYQSAQGYHPVWTS